jgi:hypothetical protein
MCTVIVYHMTVIPFPTSHNINRHLHVSTKSAACRLRSSGFVISHTYIYVGYMYVCECEGVVMVKKKEN